MMEVILFVFIVYLLHNSLIDLHFLCLDDNENPDDDDDGDRYLKFRLTPELFWQLFDITKVVGNNLFLLNDREYWNECTQMLEQSDKVLLYFHYKDASGEVQKFELDVWKKSPQGTYILKTHLGTEGKVFCLTCVPFPKMDIAQSLTRRLIAKKKGM